MNNNYIFIFKKIINKNTLIKMSELEPIISNELININEKDKQILSNNSYYLISYMLNLKVCLDLIPPLYKLHNPIPTTLPISNSFYLFNQDKANSISKYKLFEIMTIKHPHLYLNYGFVQKNGNTYRCFENISGTPLDLFIANDDTSQLEKIMLSIEIILLIDFCNSNGLCNLNIKTSNFFINESKREFKFLLNFNTTKFYNPTTLIKEEENDDFIRYKSYDRWALGVLLNELFSNEKLWSSEDNSLDIKTLCEKYRFVLSKSLNINILKIVIKNLTFIDVIEKVDKTEKSNNTEKTNNSNRSLSYDDEKSNLLSIMFEQVKARSLVSHFKNNSKSEQFYLLIKLRKLLLLCRIYTSKNLKIKGEIKTDSDLAIKKSFNKVFYKRATTLFKKKQSKVWFNRKSKVWVTGKYAIKDFYNKLLTPELIRRFAKLAKINNIESSKITVLQTVGSGGFSKVKIGQINNFTEIAIKIMNNFNMEAFIKELLVIKKINHIYIPIIYGIFKKQEKLNETLSLNIAMELIKGTTLNNLLTKGSQGTNDPNCLTVLDKYLILLDLAIVLIYLHKNGIVHRDLKPDNIMINEKMEIRLIDFGISKLCGDNGKFELSNIVGTCRYMAPENYCDESNDVGKEEEDDYSGSIPDENKSLDFSEEYSDYESGDEESFNKNLIQVSTKVDVWAYGLIINEVFSGQKPWARYVIGSDAIIQCLLIRKAKFEISERITDTRIYKVIEKCTEINQNNRYSIDQAFEKLIEAFFYFVKEIPDLNTYYMSSDLNSSSKNSKRSLLSFNKVKQYLLLYHNLLIQNSQYLDKSLIYTRHRNSFVTNFFGKNNNGLLKTREYYENIMKQLEENEDYKNYKNVLDSNKIRVMREIESKTNKNGANELLHSKGILNKINLSKQYKNQENQDLYADLSYKGNQNSSEKKNEIRNINTVKSVNFKQNPGHVSHNSGNFNKSNNNLFNMNHKSVSISDQWNKISVSPRNFIKKDEPLIEDDYISKRKTTHNLFVKTNTKCMLIDKSQEKDRRVTINQKQNTTGLKLDSKLSGFTAADNELIGKGKSQNLRKIDIDNILKYK